MNIGEAKDVITVLRALDQPGPDTDLEVVLAAARRLAARAGKPLQLQVRLDENTLVHVLGLLAEGCCCNWTDDDLAGVQLARPVTNVPDPSGRLSDPLTPRQRAVFDEVRARIAADGWPPSMREVAAATALPLSSVKDALDALSAAGYVERVPGRPRAIRLVDQAGAS